MVWILPLNIITNFSPLFNSVSIYFLNIAIIFWDKQRKQQTVINEQQGFLSLLLKNIYFVYTAQAMCYNRKKLTGVITVSDFNINGVAKIRKSIRTYIEKPLEESDRKKINDYINKLSENEHPFGAKVRIKLFDVDKEINSKDLGTYGVIKGAKTYLGVAVNETADAMEAVGYVFEKLVLYASSIGLGTCWLGGTFNRGEFAKAMQLQENEFFPIASPIGYIERKNHTVDKIMRMAIKADSRKPFESMFFEKDFSSPLSQETAGEYGDILETVRLAPSAKNGQPWRIVKDGNTFHFFEKKDIPSSNHDIQRLDIGIAGCHFDLAASQKGIKGKFFTAEALPEAKGLIYVFSWVKEG